MSYKTKGNKKFIPKFIQRDRQKLKSLDTNPCLQRKQNQHYICSQLANKDSGFYKSFLVCLEEKGVPYLDNKTKKINYFKRKIYNSSHFQPLYQGQPQKQNNNLLILESDEMLKKKHQDTMNNSKIQSEQNKQKQKGKIYTLSKLKVKQTQPFKKYTNICQQIFS